MTRVMDDLCRSESGAPCSVDPEVVVDLTTLLETAGGDRALLDELIEMFREDCPKYMAEIRAAVSDGDPGLLMSAAHTLKGLLGSLGARRAYAVSHRLETMSRVSDMGSAAEVFDAMESEILKVEQALASLCDGGAPS